jgi:succinate dehydrogenase / fumarate reductase membrane anchor subunit
MSMMTPRARVRGLGSARSGTEHWWTQRLSAISMALLAPLFFIPFAIALGKPWDEVVAIYKYPFNAIVAALFLLAVFHHMRLGLQVVIEDYIHAPALRTGLVIAVKLGTLGLGLAAAFSVAMVAFAV